MFFRKTINGFTALQTNETLFRQKSAVDSFVSVSTEGFQLNCASLLRKEVSYAIDRKKVFGSFGSTSLVDTAGTLFMPQSCVQGDFS